MRAHSTKINIFVPLYAKSAGTLICLGADQIFLTNISELGPLDAQIPEAREGDGLAYRSALEAFNALEQIKIHTLETMDTAARLILDRSGMKMSEAVNLAIEFAGQTSGKLYSGLDALKIGGHARALGIAERYGITILSRYMKWSVEQASSVVQRLVKGYPSHTFILDIEELQTLALPGKEMQPEEAAIVDNFIFLFAQLGDIIKLVEPTLTTNNQNVDTPNQQPQQATAS